jgi:hypothetical protein
VASVPFVVVGGAVQAGGFVIALRQAATMRREEAPDHPSLPRQAWALLLGSVEQMLVRVKFKRGRTQVAKVSARLSAEGGMRARAHVVRKGQPLEQRLDEIERELHELQAQQEDDHEALQRKIDGVSDEVKAEADRLESERTQRLIRSLDWEEAGILTFILGLTLTTVGAIV